MLNLEVLTGKILSKKEFVWLPSDEQELLLKAGLLKDPAAVMAWERWKAEVHLEKTGEADKRLFPLIYHNLQTLGYTDELTKLLRAC